MDAFICIQDLPPHALNQLVENDPAVQGGIGLYNLQIVQIRFFKRAFQPCKLIRKGTAMFFQIFLSLVQIVFCHFLSEASASGMYDDIKLTFIIPVNFNEMVAASQSSETEKSPVCPYMRPAEKRRKIKVICLAVGAFS
jgi:hypothetical protein